MNSIADDWDVKHQFKQKNFNQLLLNLFCPLFSTWCLGWDSQFNCTKS